VFLTQDLRINTFKLDMIVSVVETPRPLTGHQGLLCRPIFTRDCLFDMTIWVVAESQLRMGNLPSFARAGNRPTPAVRNRVVEILRRLKYENEK